MLVKTFHLSYSTLLLQPILSSSQHNLMNCDVFALQRSLRPFRTST